MARIAIIYYSTWGHIRKLAGFIKEGIESAGGQVDVYQIAETLPEEVLIKMHATPKSEDPIATPDTLTQYDAYLFGVPTDMVTSLLNGRSILGSYWWLVGYRCFTRQIC